MERVANWEGFPAAVARRGCQALRHRAALASHQAGRFDDRAAAFREAEAMQAEREPQYPWLYSLRGCRHCDLLLGRLPWGDAGGVLRIDEARRLRSACREVLERATQTLEWMEKHCGLLDVALDHLSIGRAHLGLGLAASAAGARTVLGGSGGAVACRGAIVVFSPSEPRVAGGGSLRSACGRRPRKDQLPGGPRREDPWKPPS